MQSEQKPNNTSHTAHIQGVNASSAGLLKVTVGAAAVAGAILAFIWLPAEHGIDPTGVGHLLGLTEMGHIKEHLHEQADADAAKAAVDAAANHTQGDPDLTQRLNSMQSQLDAIALAVGAKSSEGNEQTALANTTANTIDAQVSWQHEDNYTLEPGEGIEVKLVMDEGAVAEFEWTANGAVVNHDTHGDGHGDEDGKSISYKKGRSVSEQAGQLVAAFNGNHGWYWRNRTENDVVITLRTKGDYKEILLP